MSIKAIIQPHPFNQAIREIRSLEAPCKLSDIIPENRGRPVAVVNGERIDDMETTLNDGDHVVIRILPAGGSTQSARAIDKAGIYGAGLGIAGLITSFIVPPLGFALMAGGGALLLLGGVSTLTRNEALKQLKNPATVEPVPSIRGGSNQASRWGKVPVIFGKHLIVPLYSAAPYTEIGGTDGKDMYLTQLFCLGYGPLKVSNIKLGETLLASNTAAVRNGAVSDDGSFAFTGLQVYENGTIPTLYPEIVLEDALNIELKNSALPDTLWRATAPNITKSSIDITFPRGMYILDEKGDRVSNSCTVQVKRRAFGSGTAWASATLVNTFTISSKNDPQTIRYNFTETVTAGQYEYAVYRYSVDETSARAVSDVYWTALRSIRAGVAPVDAETRANMVFLALKVKAGGDLQGVINQLNCIVESESATYDGSGTGSANWPLAFSQNPAVAFLRALRGPMNPRPISDASIDWTALEAWYTTCATKGWTCNAVVSSPSRLRDVLSQIAGCGRASLLVRDGLYSVAVDELKTNIIQQFTPRNTWNFQWSKAFKDLAHGLKVSIISADDGYAPNERIVLADGYKYDTNGDGVLRDWNGVDRTSDGAYTLATRFESIDLWGITSAELALKFGRYRLACDKLRQEVYTFDADAEAMRCEPGDLVRLSHDAMAVGLTSGRIKTVTLNGSLECTSITVDDLCVFDVSKSYAVRYRRSDGTVVYSTVTNPGNGETASLAFTSAISAATVPAVGDIFTFGEAAIETIPCIVAGVDVLDNLSLRIYAIDAADAVHTADTGTIPAFVSRVSRNAQGSIGKVIPDIVAQNAMAATQGTIAGVPETDYLPVNKGNLASDPPGTPHPHDTYFNTVSQTLKVYKDNGVDPAGFYDATTEIFTEAQIDTRVNVKAPRYLGRYLYASKPSSANEGDTATFYSTTAGERGIYLWVSTAWVKQTTPTTEMISSAWADICWIVNEVTDYGEATAYTGTGVNFIEVLGANVAFMNELFAQYIKVQTGGSIRGGDRYDESGAVVDGTVPGFYISASGACKVAGIEFEGSQGGGVQWGLPSQIGTDLNISGMGVATLAAMNGTDVAFFDALNNDLRLYRFNGSIWAVIGTELNISGAGIPSLTALNSTDIAFIDNTNKDLRVYRFNGSTWSQVGNDLNISTMGLAAISALNSTDVALVDGVDDKLRTYQFDGTDWSLVGNDLSISGVGIPSLTALNSTDVAFIDGTNKDLRVYRFNGTTWSQIGNDLNISTMGNYSGLAAMNGTDVVFIDDVGDALKIYRFDGTDWAQVSSAGSVGISTSGAPCLCALNGSDLAFLDTTNDDIRVYRFSFAVSIPYSRSLTD